MKENIIFLFLIVAVASFGQGNKCQTDDNLIWHSPSANSLGSMSAVNGDLGINLRVEIKVKSSAPVEGKVSLEIWHDHRRQVNSKKEVYSFPAAGAPDLFIEPDTILESDDDTLIPFTTEIFTFYDQHWKRDVKGEIRFEPAQSPETWWIAVKEGLKNDPDYKLSKWFCY